VLGHVGQEGDDVVVGLGLDLLDALDLEGGALADREASSLGTMPSSACASVARTSISFQISNLFSSSQMRAISGRE
jgi:hypothetical protein